MSKYVLMTVAGLFVAACSKPVPPIYENPVPFGQLATGDVAGPRLTRGPTGVVMLSWMERGQQGAALRASKLGQDGWGTPLEIVDDPAMFVNWADLPSVLALGDEHWVAHWLSYSADLTYSYDIRFMQSPDAGGTWSEPLTPHTDGTPTEHGFVSMWPATGGTGMLWLDGRKMVNDVGDDPRDSGMSLRAARIDRSGARHDEQIVDELVCECCQTDVAVTSGGPLAVYRDRTPAEIRDIYLARFGDGAWQSGGALSNDGWEIAGCPVNGPAIAADGDLVAIAWFTAAANSPRVLARVSQNGGRTFGDTVVIDTGPVIGYVGVASVGDDSFAVSWVKRDGDLHDIRVRSLTTAGELGRVRTAGRTAVAHTVPQMVEHDGHLIFAWTDVVREQSRLAIVSVEIVHAE